MTTLTVDAEDDESELFGVTVSDMQDNISINSDGYMTGTLKYVDGTDWTAGTWGTGLDTGNFLALKVEADDDAIVTAELLGGVGGPVTLDEDMNIVFRVTSNTQKVRIIATNADGSDTKTKVIRLGGLTLESAGD